MKNKKKIETNIFKTDLFDVFKNDEIGNLSVIRGIKCLTGLSFLKLVFVVVMVAGVSSTSFGQGNWGNVSSNNPTYTNGNVIIGWPAFPINVKTGIFTNSDDFGLKVRNIKFSNFPNQPRYGVHSVVDDQIGKAPKYALYGEATGANAFGVYGKSQLGYAGYFEGKGLFSEDLTVDKTLFLKESGDNNIFVRAGIDTRTISMGALPWNSNYWAQGYMGFNFNKNKKDWTLKGTGSHNGGSMFLGDAVGTLRFYTLNSTGGSDRKVTDTEVKQNERLTLHSNGSVKLHTGTSGLAFAIDYKNPSNTSDPLFGEDVFRVWSSGHVECTELEVKLAPFPDYVFEETYELMSMEQLRIYIDSNKHLPNIPSAESIKQNGIGVGELQVKQMEKIEELTLYILQLKEEMEALKAQVKSIIE